jgi:hypothetical protein
LATLRHELRTPLGAIKGLARPARASPSRLANFRRLIEKCRFARDSPVEGRGFEPLVPLMTETHFRAIRASLLSARFSKRAPAVIRILSFACCRGHHDSGTTELTDKICSRSQFEVQQGGVLLSPINVVIAKIGETTNRYFRIVARR